MKNNDPQNLEKRLDGEVMWLIILGLWICGSCSLVLWAIHTALQGVL